MTHKVVMLFQLIEKVKKRKAKSFFRSFFSKKLPGFSGAAPLSRRRHTYAL